MSEHKYGRFHFRGGHPALDFINTASERNRERLTERLGSYDDLVSWAEQAGVVDGGRAAQLHALAAARPRAAAAALRRARGLREASFRLFESLIEGRAPVAADLALLNRRASRASGGGEVRWQGDGFRLALPPAAAPLDEPLEQVARGIVEVLTGEQSHHVSRCQNFECSWLFLDRSPARGRRWCSMADCGNRAKARRHYERHRKQGA